MKTIVEQRRNRWAFDVCLPSRHSKRVSRKSFSVYVYTRPETGAWSYGPAFYVGWPRSQVLPKPNEPRAVVRIRVYPKGSKANGR